MAINSKRRAPFNWRQWSPLIPRAPLNLKNCHCFSLDPATAATFFNHYIFQVNPRFGQANQGILLPHERAVNSRSPGTGVAERDKCCFFWSSGFFCQLDHHLLNQVFLILFPPPATGQLGVYLRCLWAGVPEQRLHRGQVRAIV